jgi:hypothetical protein
MRQSTLISDTQRVHVHHYGVVRMVAFRAVDTVELAALAAVLAKLVRILVLIQRIDSRVIRRHDEFISQ